MSVIKVLLFIHGMECTFEKWPMQTLLALNIPAPSPPNTSFWFVWTKYELMWCFSFLLGQGLVGNVCTDCLVGIVCRDCLVGTVCTDCLSGGDCLQRLSGGDCLQRLYVWWGLFAQIVWWGAVCTDCLSGGDCLQRLYVWWGLFAQMVWWGTLHRLFVWCGLFAQIVYGCGPFWCHLSAFSLHDIYEISVCLNVC